MNIKKTNDLVLSCSIHIVDVQSEASGAEADGENEKVLCGHCLTLILGDRGCSALDFFDNRQVCWLGQNENNCGREHRSDGH